MDALNRQLQSLSEEPFSSCGYKLSHIQWDDLVSSQMPRTIAFGDLQTQRIRNVGGKDGTAHYQLTTQILELHNQTETSFDFITSHDDTANQIDAPEAFLEAVLTKNVAVPHQYLITEAHSKQQRLSLGLPCAPLCTTPRLLASEEHYPGIHSSYAYVSPGISFTPFHREDFGLQSVNMLHHGMPKIWLLIHPRHTEQFEAQITKLLKIQRPSCTQFVRHENIILPPSLLRQWGIMFSVVLHQPRHVMVTDYNVYHYVLNTGSNIAEAVNLCESTWLPPPLYRDCVRSDCEPEYGGSISAAGMQIGSPIELNVSTIHLPRAPEYRQRMRSARERDVCPQDVQMPVREKPMRAKKHAKNKRNEQARQRKKLFRTVTPLSTPTDSVVTLPLDVGCHKESSHSEEQWSIDNMATVGVSSSGEADCDRLLSLIEQASSYGSLLDPEGSLSDEQVRVMCTRFRPEIDEGRNSWLGLQSLALILGILTSRHENVIVVEGSGLATWQPRWVPEIILIPVCSRNVHWVLVVIDCVSHSIRHYDKLLNTEMQLVMNAAKKLDPRAPWNLEQKPHFFSQTNRSDCGLILLVDAEIDLGLSELEGIPRESIALRIRYLEILLRPVQTQLSTQKAIENIRSNRINLSTLSDHSSYNTELTSWPSVTQIFTEHITNVASAEIFAQICVTRRMGWQIQLCRGQALVQQVIELATRAEAQSRVSGWDLTYSQLVLCQRYRIYLTVAKSLLSRVSTIRRRETNQLPGGERRRPIQSTKVAIFALLLEWLHGNTTDVAHAWSEIRSRELTREEEGRITYLRKMIVSGEGLYNLLESWSIRDPLSMPLWMLMPQCVLAALSKLQLGGQCQFWRSIRTERPHLWARLPEICSGLRIILGVDLSQKLPIDDMNPAMIIQERIDSSLLLGCLCRV